MSGYLLDTNVVSELTRDAPDPQVVSFLSEREDVWLSSILIHEVEYGLRLLPLGPRRSRLSAMQAEILGKYDDHILPLDRVGAEWSAEFRAQARRAGRTIDMGDMLIAGIAKVNDMAIATRNVRDFDGLDVDVVNPWEVV